tara:strand:- start:224 stop:367 length:144 start_codon:yes stop_codon:yes gene_type:complete
MEFDIANVELLNLSSEVPKLLNYDVRLQKAKTSLHRASEVSIMVAQP